MILLSAMEGRALLPLAARGAFPTRTPQKGSLRFLNRRAVLRGQLPHTALGRILQRFEEPAPSAPRRCCCRVLSVRAKFHYNYLAGAGAATAAVVLNDESSDE